MASKFDQNLLPGFDSVKDDDEEILWTAKPKFIPYAITGLAAGFGIVIFVAIYFAMTKNANKMKLATTFLFGFLQFPLFFFFSLFFKNYFHIPIQVTA